VSRQAEVSPNDWTALEARWVWEQVVAGQRFDGLRGLMCTIHAWDAIPTSAARLGIPVEMAGNGRRKAEKQEGFCLLKRGPIFFTSHLPVSAYFDCRARYQTQVVRSPFDLLPEPGECIISPFAID